MAFAEEQFYSIPHVEPVGVSFQPAVNSDQV